MSVIKIVHGERRTENCLAVRKMGPETDEIVCWLTGGAEAEIDLPDDGSVYTMTLEPMTDLFAELAGDEVKEPDFFDGVPETTITDDEIDQALKTSEELEEIDPVSEAQKSLEKDEQKS